MYIHIYSCSTSSYYFALGLSPSPQHTKAVYPPPPTTTNPSSSPSPFLFFFDPSQKIIEIESLNRPFWLPKRPIRCSAVLSRRRSVQGFAIRANPPLSSTFNYSGVRSDHSHISASIIRSTGLVYTTEAASLHEYPDPYRLLFILSYHIISYSASFSYCLLYIQTRLVRLCSRKTAYNQFTAILRVPLFFRSSSRRPPSFEDVDSRREICMRGMQLRP